MITSQLFKRFIYGIICVIYGIVAIPVCFIYAASFYGKFLGEFYLIDLNKHLDKIEDWSSTD